MRFKMRKIRLTWPERTWLFALTGAVVVGYFVLLAVAGRTYGITGSAAVTAVGLAATLPLLLRRARRWGEHHHRHR